MEAFRGRGIVWASEGSSITHLPTHILTSSQKVSPCPLFHHFPSALSGIQGTWSLSSCRAGTGIYLFNSPFSFRGRDPCWHATPSYSVGRHQKSVQMSGWGLQGRAHQPPVLPFVVMCTGYTWEWGSCAPSATNRSSTLTHSDITRRVT